MGRSKAHIDWAKVDSYLRAGCDGVSLASFLGIHYNTLYNSVKAKYNCEFSEYSQKKKAEGVRMVEYTLYIDAMKRGGADRMFWLKNHAGYADKQEFKGDLSITQLPEIIIKTRDKNG